MHDLLSLICYSLKASSILFDIHGRMDGNKFEKNKIIFLVCVQYSKSAHIILRSFTSQKKLEDEGDQIVVELLSESYILSPST